MRKNNSALVLFVFLMFVSMVLGMVYADNEDEYNEEGYVCEDNGVIYIDPEYTTIYENDEININVGCDGDCNFDKNTKKLFEITFDKDIFELDVSGIKSVRKGIEYLDFKVNEKDNKITYTINFKVTGEYKNTFKYMDCFNASSEMGLYDLENYIQIEDIIFENIKLKVKDNAKLETYIINDLPITIIKNENTSNVVKYLNYDSKDFINGYCGIKCKMLGIGNRIAKGYDGATTSWNQVTVLYENGEKADLFGHGGVDWMNTYFDVDFSYNNVYRNDTIDITLKKVYHNAPSLVIDEKFNLVKYDSGNYKVLPIYFVFEKDTFEINFDKLKINNDNFIFHGVEKSEVDNKYIYKLYLESKNVFTTNNDLNLTLSNIELKIKENASYGKNLIKISMDDFWINRLNKYSLDDIVLSYVINVIDNKSSLNNIEIYEGCLSELSGKITYFDIKENKVEYKHNDIDCLGYLNVICNKRCHFKYDDSEPNKIKVDVRYDDGLSKQFILLNVDDDKVDSKIKNHFSFLEDYKFVTVIGNNEINAESYLKYIENIFNNNKTELGKYYYDFYYYNYDEFDNSLIEQFKYEFGIEVDDSDFPYIIISSTDLKRKLSILKDGITEEKINDLLNAVFFEHTLNFDVNLQDNETTIRDDNVMGNLVTKSDEILDDDLSFNNELYLVVVIILLVIIIIVVIIIIIKKKRNKIVHFADVSETLIVQNENIESNNINK